MEQLLLNFIAAQAGNASLSLLGKALPVGGASHTSSSASVLQQSVPTSSTSNSSPPAASLSGSQMMWASKASIEGRRLAASSLFLSPRRWSGRPKVAQAASSLPTASSNALMAANVEASGALPALPAAISRSPAGAQGEETESEGGTVLRFLESSAGNEWLRGAVESMDRRIVQQPMQGLRQLNQQLKTKLESFLTSQPGRQLSNQISHEMNSGALLIPVALMEELLKARMRTVALLQTRRWLVFFGWRAALGCAVLHAVKSLIRRFVRRRVKKLRASTEFVLDVMLPTGFFGPVIGITFGVLQLTGTIPLTLALGGAAAAGAAADAAGGPPLTAASAAAAAAATSAVSTAAHSLSAVGSTAAGHVAAAGSTAAEKVVSAGAVAAVAAAGTGAAAIETVANASAVATEMVASASAAAIDTVASATAAALDVAVAPLLDAAPPK